MGNLKKSIKERKVLRGNVINLDEIAGTFSPQEKEKLLSGEGFVKVPTEELKRLRIDVYPYLM
ncbi:hypothetical protein M1B78_03055 [Bacteroides sp. KH569_7]|uniref:Uncharacterized protein n=1 Tax=Bacteroides muris (ex Fokt et al. 2023) TaxID=2937417 RepID=A0A9X2SUF3_9BACE|nr:hypothetical protein [Bacteroides muris (ex Fokt et al. 2023)]MCR6506013.1 hypothetical protein [Bacteroides muris (ex Fokt et al. 2023)]MCR6507175.1 hypothetical protein [Bacteroides muris (ex Fokt et al. 2023)]